MHRAYKNGKYHGLSLDVESNHARVDLNKNGEVISYFRFDKNFNEVFRNDPKELISYITAKRFKPQPKKLEVIKEGEEDDSEAD